MNTTKALVAFVRLRERRDRLARNPPDTKKVVYERFTEMEAGQLRSAEAQLNRLSGARAIELLIAHRGSVLGYINR